MTEKSVPQIQEIQTPLKEGKIQGPAKPGATKGDVEGGRSGCVDHLCGCKR